jgi:hypothetical protein
MDWLVNKVLGGQRRPISPIFFPWDQGDGLGDVRHFAQAHHEPFNGTGNRIPSRLVQILRAMIIDTRIEAYASGLKGMRREMRRRRVGLSLQQKG